MSKISKQLSYILRHNPESANMVLDKDGYAVVNNVLEFFKINIHTLENLIKIDDKQRFSFNKDKTLIRASQGHTINVNINFKEIQPVTFLYHGTAEQYKDIIMKDGLKKMQRHHVHLASEHKDSVTVGMRKGTPVLLEIDAPRMYREGYKFYISDNGVYLTDFVPSKYIKII